ncbi:KilA-N domain-containing protein [Synechococcus sp. CBW1108]|uniref:KilA-N domain-containing protein n=1 Tax=Synechococcus sp. CBW1108 TaxID=1353147 RepID=UPI0018CDD821|nr:KilA-N domain-containing protein [Synechococcus sp. CBW1108]QPN69943.1 KilA-N domain-containing protein [Synechococcus sp. CBW1108]
MNTHTLVSRSSNGTSISRRASDGYVNATAMCKANGKQCPKYRESVLCQSYLDTLAETSVIRMFDLVESRQVKSYRHFLLANTLKRYRAQVAGN